MRTTVTTRRGVRVCILDFSNITDEATALAAIEESRQVIAKERPGSVYTLTDVTGSRVTPRIRTALHELTKANAPYVVAGAVVGLTSLQMIILRGIVQLTRRRLVAKNSRDEALEWLAAEAAKEATAAKTPA